MMVHFIDTTFINITRPQLDERREEVPFMRRLVVTSERDEEKMHIEACIRV